MGNSCGNNRKVIIGSQYQIQNLATPQQSEHFNRGKFYEHKGLYQNAIRQYTEAIRHNAASGISYNGIGNCTLKLGDTQTAILYFNKAIQLDPYCKFAYNGLATCYESINKDNQAIANFNKAIEIDRNFAYPYNGLGNLHYFNQNYAAALPFYQTAVKLTPNNPLVHANLACCQIMMGNFDQSFDSFLAAHKTAKISKQDLSPSNKDYLSEKLNQFTSAVQKADPKNKDKFIEIMNRDFETKTMSNSGLRDDRGYSEKIIADILSASNRKVK